MVSDATLPVITGLAIGIGFVVVFSIFFTPTLNSNGSNSAVILGEAGQSISIDIGVALPERDMIVKKGETVRVPVTIETLGNAEKVLSLSVMPYTFDGSEVADGSQLALSLDKESVTLSEDNIAQGKARINEYGWVITDAGFLTITASPTAATGGPYEYTVEARYAGEPGILGEVSGQLITVTVTD